MYNISQYFEDLGIQERLGIRRILRAAFEGMVFGSFLGFAFAVVTIPWIYLAGYLGSL